MSKRRGAAAAAMLLMMMVAASSPSVVAHAADGDQSCPGAADSRYDALRALLPTMVAAGQISQAKAESVACDPAAEVTRIAAAAAAGGGTITTVAESDSVVAAAASCPGKRQKFRQSANYHYELPGWPSAGWMDGNLQWCYNNKTVSHWAGYCRGGTNAYGTAIGISWAGCLNNDFIPYVLGAYYPGGIHHAFQGYWGENYVGWPQISSPIVDIWGHFDGSCDHKTGGPVYHYC